MLEEFLKEAVEECVEYLNESNTPYTLNGTVITVGDKEYKFYIEGDYLYMNTFPDKPQLGTYLPYMFKCTVKQDADRLSQFMTLMGYKPIFLRQDKVRLNKDNTEIICVDKGYNKFDYIDHIYKLTSQYPLWDFIFVIEEERFIFQYGFYKESAPITQEGMGKLDIETLDAVIEHLEKNHIEKETDE